jgi:hypothetical protein
MHFGTPHRPYTPLDLSDIYKSSAARPLNPLQMQQAMMNKGKMARDAQERGIMADTTLSPLERINALNRVGAGAAATQVQLQYLRGTAAESALAATEATSAANMALTEAWKNDPGNLEALIAAITPLNAELASRLQDINTQAVSDEKAEWENKNKKEVAAMAEAAEGLKFFTGALVTGMNMELQGMDTAKYWENIFIGWRAMPGVDPAAIDKVEADFDPSNVMDTFTDMISLNAGLMPEDLEFRNDRLREKLTAEQKKSNAEAREAQQSALTMIANRNKETYESAREFVEAMLGKAGGGGGLQFAAPTPPESALFKKVFTAALNFQYGDKEDPSYRYLLRLSTGFYGAQAPEANKDYPGQLRSGEVDQLRAKRQLEVVDWYKAQMLPPPADRLSSKGLLLNPLELGPPVAPPQPAPVYPLDMTPQPLGQERAGARDERATPPVVAAPAPPPPGVALGAAPMEIAPIATPPRTFTAADLEQDGLTLMQIREIVIGLRNSDSPEYAQAISRLQAGFTEALMQWQRSPDGLTNQKRGELKSAMIHIGLTSTEIETVMSQF